MKKLIAICMMLTLLVTAFAGCGSKPQPAAEAPAEKATEAPAQAATEAPAEKKMKVAYTLPDLSNTYFVEVSNGVKARCEELGIEVVIHDGKSDVANQVTAFENFIAQGVDAIIVSPLDEKALVPSVKAAVDAGITVIAGNQNVEGSQAFLTVPEYEYGLTIGEHAGQWIADKLNGEAEVAIFDYPELESIIARGDGIQDGILKVAPNAKIVARQSANNPEKGMAVMENILQAHPNVEVLVCVNDAGALGAYEVIVSANKASDKFYIGGLDATQEAISKIAEGGIYRATVDIQPFESGKLFVDTALKVIESGPIAETIEIPMKVVDASNVGDYTK